MTYEAHLLIQDPHRLILDNLPFNSGQAVKIVIFTEDESPPLAPEVQAELFSLIGLGSREGLPEPPLINGKAVSEYPDLYLYGLGAEKTK